MKKQNKALLFVDIAAAVLVLVKAISLYRENRKIRFTKAVIEEEIS